ncbi:hypothetical protein NT6N_20790 [Oceaniferula spumae]|uniref:Uncharacterized protein n=1 Tax=Oceaniferula spumae TaxID=2979115 RepID=A0AAT9FM93_9BACT
MPSGSTEFALLLILFLCFLLFIGGWVSVCWMLSHLGGWHKLAKQYRRQHKPTGKKHFMASAKIGLANYNNCLTLYTSPDGLYLSVWPMFRIGHPPLFLPWSELHNPQSKNFLWAKYVEFEIGSPKITTLSMAEKHYNPVRQQDL